MFNETVIVAAIVDLKIQIKLNYKGIVEKYMINCKTSQKQFENKIVLRIIV